MSTRRAPGWPVSLGMPVTAPQLLGGDQERQDCTQGGCPAPGVAAPCLWGAAGCRVKRPTPGCLNSSGAIRALCDGLVGSVG